jgi:hypothetical protein
MLDELGCAARGRPSLQIEQRRGACPADEPADRRGRPRMLPSAHERQATRRLVDADDVCAVFVALDLPVIRVHPDDGVAW